MFANFEIKILTNDTVYDYVEKIYVIDGRYEGRLDEPESHMDYLTDLSQIYSKLHIVNMDGSKQIAKRNKYWELAQVDQMDYMIVCDSDEYMDFDIPKLIGSLRTLDARPEMLSSKATYGRYQCYEQTKIIQRTFYF